MEAPMAQFLASNQMLGLVLIALLAGLGWWQRDLLRDIVSAPSRAWRILAWVTFGLTCALVLWFTFADDWRKVFGELLDIGEKFPSQRAVIDPVDPAIRRVSLVLLIVTLPLTGGIFARYVGGYGLQAVLIILGVSSFFPSYLIRQRLDTGLAGILELPSFFSVAMLGTLFYLLLSYAVNIALILTTYIGLLGIAALPITAILDLLGRREAPIRPTDEVNDFYTRLSAGVQERRSAQLNQRPHGSAPNKP
jgi:hypothetical protein